MTYTLAVILSFSILIPALAGIFRFRYIEQKSWLPFLLCIWVGLANEITGYILARVYQTNAVNNNIYVLVESMLLTWQFNTWESFKRRPFLFQGLLVLFAVFWLTECFIFNRLNLNNSYFRLFYSFVLVALAVPVFNRQLLQERKNILANPVFLVCLGILVYFTYSVIVGSFRLYGFRGTALFRKNIFIIMIYINFLTNLIFAAAILCIPRKHRSILPW